MPVDDVDFADATDEEFEFSLVERTQEIGRNQFVETLLQWEKLLLGASHEPIGDVQPADDVGEGNCNVKVSEPMTFIDRWSPPVSMVRWNPTESIETGNSPKSTRIQLKSAEFLKEISSIGEGGGGECRPKEAEIAEM